MFVRSSHIVAVLVFWAALALPSNAQAGRGKFKQSFVPHAKVLSLKWSGKIDRPMARQLKRILIRYQGRASRLVLTLASGGGRVSEARKVIALLRRFSQTHALETRVSPGRVCGSMCVPIFLQGEIRRAAPASLWLFHEISRHDKKTNKTIRLLPKKTARMFKDYFVPAGVSKLWLKDVAAQIEGNDIWLTGAQLIAQRSNIITAQLPDLKRRKVYSRRRSSGHRIVISAGDKPQHRLVPAQHRLVPAQRGKLVPAQHRLVPAQRGKLVPAQHRLVPAQHRLVPAQRGKLVNAQQGKNLQRGGDVLRGSLWPRIVRQAESKPARSKAAGLTARSEPNSKNHPGL